MKKIFNILPLVAGMLFLTTSCDNELEQLPNDSTPVDVYYQNVTEFETALNGVYSAFLSGGYYGGSFLSRPDITTDNVTLHPAGRQSNRVFYEWRYNGNASWDLMYPTYLVTARANKIIDEIDNISGASERDDIFGQARAARAIALFDALRAYSKIPTQSADANGSLGMPIVETFNIFESVLRSDVEQSYDFVISELEDAKALVSSSNDSDRITRNTVNAFLSRAYLYTGEYEKAIDAADAVTASIAPRSNFSGVWNDSNTDGVLFKVNQDRLLDGTSLGVEWSQSVDGKIRAEYVISYELFQLYEDSDIRKSAYVTLSPDNEDNLINAITKYLGEAGQNNGIVDPKIIRVAEVYLNKAEAHAMLDEDALALAALDMVRSNRYSGFVSGNETGVDLLNEIKKERRLELFAEGHRLFDLKRWNESVVRSTTFGQYFDGSGTPVESLYSELDAGDFKFQLPIPQRELELNPEFQQNPNY